MTSATSTVDAAIDALLAAILAQPTLGLTASPAVQVSEGPPTQTLADNVVIVAETVTQRYVPSALVGGLGSQALQEQFGISIRVVAYLGGDDAKSTRQLCASFVTAIDNAVRDDPTLADTVYLAYPSSHEYSSDFAENNSGRTVTCEMQVTCQAIP